MVSSIFRIFLPNHDPWEYMEVELLYIKEQTAKTIVLAVFDIFVYILLMTSGVIKQNC